MQPCRLGEHHSPGTTDNLATEVRKRTTKTPLSKSYGPMSKCPRGVQAALCFQPWSASSEAPARERGERGVRPRTSSPASHLPLAASQAPALRRCSEKSRCVQESPTAQSSLHVFPSVLNRQCYLLAEFTQLPVLRSCAPPPTMKFKRKKSSFTSQRPRALNGDLNN